ncbi:D-alanyl-D-alanine carboxypeptidase/D-alanyl-D-alanine-endopeptidase (penicillin-binding protein 4) [Catenulispora sp. GP43]|uniref:D-alanyl-D-alanine carboxypeptidase/D-alanyl-D-alanine endopeptidase n=1 Tax=Catenulispora sp. GP43 TaxID=3156263 RepID=UPI0035151C9D
MARQVPGTLPTAIVSAALGIVLAAGCVWAAGPWSGGQRVSERENGLRGRLTPVAEGVVPPSPPAPSSRSAGPTHVPAGAALDPVLAGDKPGGGLTAAELAGALGPLTLAPGLGKHVGIAVADPASPTLLFDDHAADGFAPASTNKVVTAVAALAALGPDDRFTTRVVQGPNSGATASIVLVGGGDPTLSTQGPSADPGYQPASLDDLAARTAAALRAEGVKSVTLGYDASVFSGPGLNPTWSPEYTDGNVAPVTGLMVDEGRARAADDLSPRVTDPAGVAAGDFASRLVAHGIQVTGKPAAASAGSGAQLADVTSLRLADLVEHMLTVSDNDLAEALLRHVAVADGRPATFDGGVAAVRDELGKLGLDVTGLDVLDGSGLSRKDSITPAFEVRVLSAAAADNHPDLRAALTGLPVAGFTGTLAEDGRYTTPPSLAGAGLVRAKTGSLTGVVTLAGLVRDSSGQLLVFSLMADAAPDSAAARAAVDRLATTLAGCGCGGG